MDSILKSNATESKKDETSLRFYDCGAPTSIHA